MSPHLHPVIVLHEVEEDMMELLMRYMYSGQVSVTEEQLVPLVQAAKDLGIKVWLIDCLSTLVIYTDKKFMHTRLIPLYSCMQ